MTGARVTPYLSYFALGLCRIFLACLLFMGIVPPKAMADEKGEYVRGYVDALLDSRYPGLGLRVLALTRDGRVTLTSTACLGPSQKREIVRMRSKAGMVKTVRCTLPAVCNEPATDEQSADAASEDVPPSTIDIRAFPEQEH